VMLVAVAVQQHVFILWCLIRSVGNLCLLSFLNSQLLFCSVSRHIATRNKQPRVDAEDLATCTQMQLSIDLHV
jgi:hypothetical protein